MPLWQRNIALAYLIFHGIDGVAGGTTDDFLQQFRRSGREIRGSEIQFPHFSHPAHRTANTESKLLHTVSAFIQQILEHTAIRLRKQQRNRFHSFVHCSSPGQSYAASGFHMRCRRERIRPMFCDQKKEAEENLLLLFLMMESDIISSSFDSAVVELVPQGT